jgi:hypothetical protein
VFSEACAVNGEWWQKRAAAKGVPSGFGLVAVLISGTWILCGRFLRW